MRNQNSLTHKNITVEKLISDGRGLARVQGKTIFIDNALPGEIVDIQIRYTHKTYDEAHVVNYIQKSDDRVTPPCPYFGSCGGCQTQHMSYQAQLSFKNEIIADQLRRLGQRQVSIIEQAPILPSSKELRYRRRIQVHVQNGKLGFKKRLSQEIISVQDCWIADARLTLEFPKILGKTSGRYELTLSDDQQAVHITQDQDFSEREFLQANLEQNLKMQNEILQLLKSFTMGETLLELYCGSGNLSFAIALQCPGLSILAVDINPKNIHIAQEKNRFSNLRFKQAPAHEILDVIQDQILLVDPPRDGLDIDLIQSLEFKPVKIIIYVSCHLATFTRDVLALQKIGFVLETVRPLDMFPQTHHLELITLLRRL